MSGSRSALRELERVLRKYADRRVPDDRICTYCHALEDYAALYAMPADGLDLSRVDWLILSEAFHHGPGWPDIARFLPALLKTPRGVAQDMLEGRLVMAARLREVDLDGPRMSDVERRAVAAVWVEEMEALTRSEEDLDLPVGMTPSVEEALREKLRFLAAFDDSLAAFLEAWAGSADPIRRLRYARFLCDVNWEPLATHFESPYSNGLVAFLEENERAIATWLKVDGRLRGYEEEARRLGRTRLADELLTVIDLLPR